MTSHLGYMALFAACVAVVFGALLRDEPRDELRLAARVFGALVVGAYATGWLMYAVFR
jgi:hypothetical protein